MAVVETLLLIYFSIPVFYTLVFALAGNMRRQNSYAEKANADSSEDKVNKIAVFVPAYKEDAIICHTASKLLASNYPKDRFDVVVIADSLKAETLESLSELDIKLFKVDFEKSTKTKSLNYAFSRLNDHYDIAIICDADNIFIPDFLSKINLTYNKGYQAIQGQRIAKNLNTSYAILDAASEMINNHIFRKGANAVGISSSVIGSGMAFNYDMIKDILSQVEAVGGFDKVMQLQLIEKGHKIHYLPDALAFDEKIENQDAFKKQRRRWLSSQFIYLKKFFPKGIKMLLKGNLDYFIIAVFYSLFPPRLLLLGMLFILTVISIIFGVAPLVWAGLTATYMLSMAISLPAKFYNKRLLIAVLSIPKAFLNMVLIMFKLKGADKQFIHTTHTKVEVDNSLFKHEN
ncbi:MAG: glycosyltransferase family 2 protein [Bacteroidota bacterium]